MLGSCRGMLSPSGTRNSCAVQFRPTGTMEKKMTEQDRILIEILATTDAVWRPLRAGDWAQPGPSNLYEARRRFSEHGVAVNTGSGTEGARKAAQRIVADLVASGLLVAHGNQRRKGVTLTPPAEAGLRALCDLPSLPRCTSDGASRDRTIGQGKRIARAALF